MVCVSFPASLSQYLSRKLDTYLSERRTRLLFLALCIELFFSRLIFYLYMTQEEWKWTWRHKPGEETARGCFALQAFLCLCLPLWLWCPPHLLTSQLPSVSNSKIRLRDPLPQVLFPQAGWGHHPLCALVDPGLK